MLKSPKTLPDQPAGETEQVMGGGALGAADWLEIALTVVGVALSAGAAIFWRRASEVDIPRFPQVGFDPPPELFDPVWNALRENSRLNKLAANFSALAALDAAVTFAVHAYAVTSHPPGL